VSEPLYTIEQLERYRKAAVEFVNAYRKEHGVRAGRLVKGRCGDPRSCVIARSLEKAGVGSAHFAVASGAIELRKGIDPIHLAWDQDVARFMDAFDHYEYPDLVIKRKAPIKVGKRVVTTPEEIDANLQKAYRAR
jgi:hypothetical protein